MGTFYLTNDFRAYLSHGGPGSGRYPKGSGKNPFQHVKAHLKGSGEKWLKQDVKAGKDKAPVSRAEKTARAYRDIFDEASNAAGRMGDMKRRKQRSNSDASKLSDKELNDAIRRMRLEREYSQLKTNDISSGYDKVQDILSVAGSLAGIAASAATVASIFYSINRSK